MKKLMIIMIMSVVFLGASAFKATDEKVIMTVSFEVKNFKEWKSSFDAGEAVRTKAGIKVLNIFSSAENENQVLVIEEADSMGKAKEFLELLKSKQSSGDISKVEIKLYNQKD